MKLSSLFLLSLAATGHVAARAAPSPAPGYYGAPVGYAPPVGTVVAALPGGCANMIINGVSYMNCGGVYYVPYYSGGTLLYEVTIP